jgi:uncharacterized membrane protein YdjX (TVP38/TMEM64 family)
MTEAPLQAATRPRLGRWGAIAGWALLVAGAAAALVWAGEDGLLTQQALVAHAAALDALVRAHFLAAAILYIAVYVAAALLLCPAQLWVIVTGALTFGLADGLVLSWIGAMAGALAVFVAAKRAFAGHYSRRMGPVVEAVRAEFERSGMLYMLALRWLPVSPYCVANAAPPLLGARLGPFMLVAAVGVLPDVITYSAVGAAIRGVVQVGRGGDAFALVREVAPALFAIGFSPLVALAATRIAARVRAGAR